MKKYFTKELPTRGELKIGDRTLWPVGHEGYYSGKMFTVNEGCIDHLSVLNCQPWKLFLCSRDIQVGDRATDHMIAPNDGLVFQGGDKWLNDMGEEVILPDWQTRFHFIKIIGEVSPDAVFIKEGMEFDEKDVQFLMDGPGFYTVATSKEFIEETILEKYPIRFRCPSSPNHFH